MLPLMDTFAKNNIVGDSQCHLDADEAVVKNELKKTKNLDQIMFDVLLFVDAYFNGIGSDYVEIEGISQKYIVMMIHEDFLIGRFQTSDYPRVRCLSLKGMKTLESYINAYLETA